MSEFLPSNFDVPKICPKCNDNFIPNNERPGAHVGAISRRDNQTEICSDCGTREALEDFQNRRPIED